MEAKIREDILNEWMSHPSPEFNSLIEISLKAGRRDVVEWAEANMETRLLALENEVKLNVKEIMIAFKRLKDVEVKLEELETRLKCISLTPNQ